MSWVAFRSNRWPSPPPTRLPHESMERGLSSRRGAVRGLVQIGHIAGRGGQQRRLERGGRSLVLGDLRHHGLASAVEILPVVDDEFAGRSQPGEIAVDL